jgi:transposase
MIWTPNIVYSASMGPDRQTNCLSGGINAPNLPPVPLAPPKALAASLGKKSTEEAEMGLRRQALDADWLRSALDDRGAVAVNPPKSNRKRQIDCDFHACHRRHLVENLFCSVKAFRRIATRHEKTDQNCLALLWQMSADHTSPSSTAVRACRRRRLAELGQDGLPDGW